MMMSPALQACALLLLAGTSVGFMQHSRLSSTRGVAPSALQMAYGKVFVAGGAKGVGREVISKLREQGSEVVAIVRREDAMNELNAIDGVTAVMVDALDLKAVEGALDGCDAAITTLGGAPGEDEAKRVDYAGNRNVIESAGILGVTRVILVTSLGCGTSREALSDEALKVLEKSLLAKDKAEKMLMKYYTNSNAVLTEDTKIGGVIHRADVADLVVKALNSPATVRKVLTAVDPTVKSSNSAPGTVDAFAL